MKKFSLVLFLAFSLFSCNNNDDDDSSEIDGPGGTAEYIINNETDKDLVVIYQVSGAKEMDTTGIIVMNTSLKFFVDGMIGNNPDPESSFEEINFYEASNLESSLFSFSPLENEDWTITDQDLGNSGYGLTVYELTLSEENLD